MSHCYSKKPQWLPDKWNSLPPDDLKINILVNGILQNEMKL